MNYDALAYRRFRWTGVPDEVGDVERILTWWDGQSMLVDDDTIEGGKRLCPVLLTAIDRLEPFRPIFLSPDGAPVEATGLYPWSRLISVAPARKIITQLRRTERELDVSETSQAALARMRLAIKTNRRNSSDVTAIASASYAGYVPTLEVSEHLDESDLLQIGDGETHATSISDMHTVALARACQQLGVRYDAVVKRERLVTGELDNSADVVDIIRANEYNERLRLAEWTGWGFEEVI